MDTIEINAVKRKPEFSEKGWSKISNFSASTGLKRLAEKKTIYLLAIESVLKTKFNIGFDIFTASFLKEMEIGKAILRAWIRFDPDAWNIVEQEAVHILNELVETDKSFYLTLPYTIIHTTKDKSEAGDFHTDDSPYINHFFTMWAPLNDCYAQPLTLLPGSHRHRYTIKDKVSNRVAQLGFIPSMLSEKLKFNIEKKFSENISPDIELGSFMSWEGSLWHRGNLNRTESATVAVVSRITSYPLMSEPTRIIDKETRSSFASPSDRVDAKGMIEFSERFISIIEEIESIAQNGFMERIHDFDGLMALLPSAQNLTKIDAYRISFALSLVAQRLPPSFESFKISFYSLLFERDNLISIKHCLKFLIENGGIYTAEKFVSAYTKSFGSAQSHFMISEFAQREGMESLLGHLSAGNLLDWPQLDFPCGSN